MFDESLMNENEEINSFSIVQRSSSSSSSSASTSEDLRELCQLLNAERAKMFELTSRWKETSTSTIYKLEQQIETYQKKLFELEQRQTHLIEENHLLKRQIDQTTNSKSKSKRKVSIRKLKSPPPPPSPKEIRNETNDCLEQQTSIQRMFDAIKAAEVYETRQNYDESKQILLEDFCHLIWKFLQERSKPKSSFLL